MTITLNAQLRGTKKPNKIRKEGMLTIELYGPEIKNQRLAVDYNEFAKVYYEAGESSLVDLELDEKKINVIITGVQIHPITNNYIHADLRQVSLKEKIEAEAELKFIGEPVAVRELGGVFIAAKSTLGIKALPMDLVSEIEVDISGLATFNDKITVADIKAPKGVEIMDAPDTMIAAVTEPAQEESAPVSAEDEKAAIEKVEVEKGKKESEEEEKEEKK